MLKGISTYEFRTQFKTADDCYAYLFDLKWKNGYKCSKCGHDKSYKGRTKWYLRCARCKYDESVKSNNLFHKMKLPILKAFEIMHMLSNRKKGMSALEIAKTYSINPNTASLLRKKVQTGMFSSGKNQLKGKVFVNEFVTNRRSSKSKQTKVVLGCEVVRHKGKMTLGNGYAKVIKDYGRQELSSFFREKIDERAKVKTERLANYQPIANFYDLEQLKSKRGVNFKEINILKMLINAWIKGIHHHVSKEYLQNYLNEFFFKFNRKAHPKASFNKLVENFMSSKPLYFQY